MLMDDLWLYELEIKYLQANDIVLGTLLQSQLTHHWIKYPVIIWRESDKSTNMGDMALSGMDTLGHQKRLKRICCEHIPPQSHPECYINWHKKDSNLQNIFQSTEFSGTRQLTGHIWLNSIKWKGWFVTTDCISGI